MRILHVDNDVGGIVPLVWRHSSRITKMTSMYYKMARFLTVFGVAYVALTTASIGADAGKRTLSVNDEDFVVSETMSLLDKKNGFQEFKLGMPLGDGLERVDVPRLDQLSARDRAVAIQFGGTVLNRGQLARQIHFADYSGPVSSNDSYDDSGTTYLFRYFAGSYSALNQTGVNGLWTELVFDPSTRFPARRNYVTLTLRPDEVEVWRLPKIRSAREIKGVKISTLGLTCVGGRLGAITFYVRKSDVDTLTQVFTEAYGKPRLSANESSWSGKLVELHVSAGGQVKFVSTPILEDLAGFRKPPVSTQNAMEGL